MKLHAPSFALSLVVFACGDAGGGTSSTTDTTPTTPFTTTGPDASTGDPASTGGPASTSDTGDAPTTGAAETTGAQDPCADLCRTYQAAFPKVASDITDRAATDPMFMADFASLVAQGAPAVDAFKTSLANFISDAYSCTQGAYVGPSMEAAHAGLSITQSEYDAFIALIVGVLVDNGVPEGVVTACFAPPLVDPSFAASIIGK